MKNKKDVGKKLIITNCKQDYQKDQRLIKLACDQNKNKMISSNCQ